MREAVSINTYIQVPSRVGGLKDFVGALIYFQFLRLYEHGCTDLIGPSLVAYTASSNYIALAGLIFHNDERLLVLVWNELYLIFLIENLDKPHSSLI